MQVSAKGTRKPAPAQNRRVERGVRMRDRNTSKRRDNVESQTVRTEIWRVVIAKRMRFL